MSLLITAEWLVSTLTKKGKKKINENDSQIQVHFNPDFQDSKLKYLVE